MKKLVFSISTLILLCSGLLFFATSGAFSKLDIFPAITILVLAGAGIIIIANWLSSYRKKQVVEDEFSKKIMEKSASVSYYASLYMWLCFTLVNDKLSVSKEQTIGYGIIGMAVIFGIVWIYFKRKGLDNEQ